MAILVWSCSYLLGFISLNSPVGDDAIWHFFQSPQSSKPLHSPRLKQRTTFFPATLTQSPDLYSNASWPIGASRQDLTFEIWVLLFTPPKTYSSFCHVNEQLYLTSAILPNLKLKSFSSRPCALVRTGTFAASKVFNINTSLNKNKDLREISLVHTSIDRLSFGSHRNRQGIDHGRDMNLYTRSSQYHTHNKSQLTSMAFCNCRVQSCICRYIYWPQALSWIKT